MLKIGDFSKLAHVTVKTLRHYGKVGLLHPEWIDRFSGYRYYSLQQLPRLNRILALKELGFSLEEIQPMLDGSLPLERLRKVLGQKRQEVEQRLHEENARLAQVESRLLQIEKEGSLAGYEVVAKRMEAQTVACLREVLPSLGDSPDVWQRVRGELEAWLAQRSIRLLGPWFTLYLDAEYTERNVKVELGVVVEAASPRRLAGAAGGRVSLRRLPAVECMASVLHSGGFATISNAYAALFAWVERHGYQVEGAVREFYLDEKDERGQDWLVELQAPVRRSLPPRVRLPAESEKGESEMEPKIVERPAFLVMGLKYQGKNEHQEIGVMWGEFNQRMEALKYPMQAEAYGVCNWVEGAEEGVFEYVAGVGVKKVDDLPQGFVLRMIPAHRYAVFAHVGAKETLMETYRSIYQTWIPQSGLKLHPDKFDMEVYDDKFKDFAPDSVMWIYVAVE